MSESRNPPDQSTAASPPLAYAGPQTPDPEHLLPLNRGDVAVIILKLVGIYLLLFEALPFFWGAFGTLYSGVYNWAVYYYAGTFVVLTGVGVLFLVKAERFARWLLPRSGDPQALPSAPLTGSIVQQIAFSIVGTCLVAAGAIPGFASDLINWFAARQLVQGQSRPGLGPSLAGHTVELIAGIWLFYGSRSLSNYWHRIRFQQVDRQERDGPL